MPQALHFGDALREAPLSFKTIEGCSFCEELLHSQRVTIPIVNDFLQNFRYGKRILFESDRFSVVPSLGAIVPGHILLVPKFHYYSVGELTGQDLSEFEQLAQNTRQVLERVYGPTCAFEHGCVEGVGKAGACIDHAHLHMLPMTADLRAQVEAKFGPGKDIRHLSDLAQFISRGVPYLYYQGTHSSARAYEAPQAPSQFFRQLICSAISTDASWDWKRDLRIPIVEQTYESLRDALEETSTLANAASK